MRQSPLFNDDHLERRIGDFGARNKLHGLYRGIVVDDRDGTGMNRVQVRVLSLHGDSIPDNQLPYAHACSTEGGGSDWGSCVAPVRGSKVWIMFVQGDPQQPVYIGAWKSNEKDARTVAAPPAPDRYAIERPADMGNAGYTAPSGSNLPRESQAMANQEPTVRTWNKSQKGHSIVVEDRDAVERLTITDRVGNVIVMECPVKEEENVENRAQRGMRSVLTGDAIDRNRTRDTGSKIVLQDQAQSMIEMDSRKGDEKITVVANDGEGGIQSGKNRQRIELLAGANRILMESVRDGKTLARITLDANTGVVTIEGEVIVDITSPCVNITAEHINLNGHVNIAGDMTVSGRLTGGGS